MPQNLTDLTINEVSLVDRPANSETDPKTKIKIPRARIALFKRDDVEKFSHNQNRDKGRFSAGGGVGKDQHAAENADTVEGHRAAALHHATQAGDTNKPSAASKAHQVAADAHFAAAETPSKANSRVARNLSQAAAHLSKQDSTDRGDPVLNTNKGELESMTIEQIEKRLEDQDAVIKSLTDANTLLKAENVEVFKMTKEQRKAFAAMSDADKKKFLEGDEEKKKSLMDLACKAEVEKATVDGMDSVSKAEFEKAGPEKRKAMLAACDKKFPPPKDGEEEPDADDEEKKDKAKKAEAAEAALKADIQKREEEQMKKLDEMNRVHLVKMAEAEDRIAKTEAEILRINKMGRVARFTKRAETELPHTAGSPEEKGEILMKLADAFGEDSEDFAKVLGTMVAADKALNIHYREVGKSGMGPLNAEKVLESKVEEISKRDKISKEKAWDVACTEHPDLYFDYEREQRHALHSA